MKKSRTNRILRQFVRGISGFIAGAVFLSLLSLLQKIIISAQINPKGFIIPVIFGGISFTILFFWGFGLRQSRADLQKSIEEKEALLQELHHRVKNNLQLVSSLFSLSRGYSRNNDEFDLQQRLNERLDFLSHLHEILYKEINISQISSVYFFQSIISYLQTVYHDADVKVKLSIDEITCNMGKAVSLGMLVYEVISNSFIHAFSGSGKDSSAASEINLSFKDKNEAEMELVISDNGTGFSFEKTLKNNETLGIQLISILSDQIEAVIEHHDSPGSEYVLTISKRCET